MLHDENNKNENKENDEKFPGYPHYKNGEDIYNKLKEEEDLDPEQPDHLKPENENRVGLNEKDFKDDVSGSDLDIPGSELDDAEEDLGNEDEENNLYSLGGDKD